MLTSLNLDGLINLKVVRYQIILLKSWFTKDWRVMEWFNRKQGKNFSALGSLFSIDVFSTDKNMRNVSRYFVSPPFRTQKSSTTHKHMHTNTLSLSHTLTHTHSHTNTHIWQRASDFMDLMVDWIDVHNLEAPIEMIEKGIKSHKEEEERKDFYWPVLTLR